MARPVSPDELKHRILAHPGVFDPKGVHHEFSYGSHGQKLDMDAIATRSGLFLAWMDVIEDTVRERYEGRMPRAVMGVANGTNRLAEHVGAALGIGQLYTYKLSKNQVALTPESAAELAADPGGLVLGLEDVGNSGGTLLTAVKSALEAGAGRVEGLISMQRTLVMPALLKAGIPYSAIIEHVLPTFKPEDCQNLPEGFCAQGWELISHPDPTTT